MEITLEKIELVKDRTGVSYKEAKAALEAADGSVVDAIINLEESMDFVNTSAEATPESESAIKRQVKKTIAKGNMSRILVRKGDNILLNLPLTVGLLGAVIAPWGAIFGVIAAAGFNCKIEFINDKGELTDINGTVKTQYRKLRDQGQVYYDKGMETVDKIRESDLYNDLVEKGSDMYYDLKDRGQDVLEDLKEKTADGIDTDKVKESIDGLWKKGTDIFHKNDDSDEVGEDFFEGFDLDVDDAEAPAEETYITPEETETLEEVESDYEAADAAAAQETASEATPAEAAPVISDETKEDLAKVLSEVAHESGIDNL